MYVLVFQYHGGELLIDQRHKSANVDLTLLMTRPNIPGALDIELKG